MYTLGGMVLELSYANIIQWKWVIYFAMSMVDSTNAGIPIAAFVLSVEGQEIIRASLALGGKRST